MSMTPRQRITAMLNKQPIDRVPVYPLINSVSRNAIGIDYEEWTKDVHKCAEAIIKTTRELDLDCACTLVDLSVEAADFGQPLLYFNDKAACPDHHQRVVPTEDDYGNVKKIDLKTATRMQEHVELCEILVKELGEDIPVVAFVFGPLGIVSMLRGQEDMFMELYTAPEGILEAVEVVTQVLEEWIDQLCATGVDAIMFDTLYASKSIMSVGMWQEFEGDFMVRLADRVRANGKLVMLHNCGQGAYFDEQYETMKPSLVSFNHIPAGCSTMEEAVEKYADKFILMGTIDPGWFMTANLETLEAKINEEFEIFAPSQRFVLSTGCEFPACLDFTFPQKMVEMAKAYKY